MTDDRPAPSDVESYLEEIERDGWSVEDYSASYGSDDPVTVTVELEWSWTPELLSAETQRDLVKAVKHAVDGIDDGDRGAPVKDVVECVEDKLDVERGVVETTIGRLKEKGEVYQPTDDCLRVL